MTMYEKRFDMVTYLSLVFSTIVIMVQGSSCPSISGCVCFLFNLDGSQLKYDCKGGISEIPSFPLNTVYILFDDNLIKTVQAEAFENNVELFHLQIRRSGIENFPENIFVNNIKLVTLHVLETAIKLLPVKIFNTNVNLNELWICWNQLELLSGNIFANNELLAKLDISHNRIKILPTGIFDNNIELEKLVISNNQIKILPNGIFENNSKLRILLLDDNEIETLPNGIFTYNIALEYIYCQNNRIKSLPTNIFANNEALLEIDLSDNHLQIIPSDIFIKNVLLKKIEMTFNCTCIEKDVYAIIMRDIVLAFEEFSITCYGSSGSLLEKPTTNCSDFIMLDNDVMDCDVCVPESTIIPQSLNEGSSITTTTRPQIVTRDSLNTIANDDIPARTYFAIATALSVMGGVAPFITMVTMIVRKNKYRADLEHIQATGNINESEDNMLDSYWQVAEIDINELDFNDRPRIQIINIPPACHETSL